ncbi:MAG: sulfite exporter TauE/SafE family protein [Elusimicrobia bacterium]|nr:sulfite exporter TauE/SafE family protein [Elusimicrobiota bacterium]
MATIAGLLLAGAAAGVFGTLLGLGGGVFLIPLLVLVFHIPMHSAVGASLIAVIASSSAGASKTIALGFVNMRLGMSLETMTVMGALCGAWLAPHLPARLLIALFAAILFVLSGLLWRGGRSGGNADGASGAKGGVLDGEYFDPASGKTVSYSVERLPAAIGASLAAGIASGLFGIGGGVVKVPALRLLSRVPMKAAAATSTFMLGVTAASSAVLYLGRGDVPLAVAGTVALGVLFGSEAGLRLSRKLSDLTVARIFAVVMLGIAVQMMRRALAG